MVFAKLRGLFGADAPAQPQTPSRRTQITPMARDAGYALTPRPGYEAASFSRQHDLWGHRWASADTEIFSQGVTLRDKSRWLVRNNPYAAKAVASLVSNMVGRGIVPRAVTGSAKRDKKINDAFKRWMHNCDAAGQLNFFALETLMVREMIEGGEVLIRRRLRQKKGPGDVPLEIQVLEADFLDPFRNGMLSANNTMTIQGVELDNDTGKRTAYWLYPQHPGNLWLNTNKPMVSEPVPASEVLHVYEQQRTQTRGVPWGVPAFETLQLMSDYEQAEVVRKKTEACVVGIVSNAEDEYDEAIAPVVQDGDGRMVERFEPGLIAYARGGKTITFNQPTAVGGYGEYKKSQLHTIAAGYRTPYEILSGDLSEVNFSSMRGGFLEFHRLVETVQDNIIIQMALDPIWHWWCETAYLVGEIDSPDVPVEWARPAFDWVDPLSDVQARALEVRNGFKTPQSVIAEQGFNPDDVIAAIAEWNKKLDAAGVILDSDPRKTSTKGQHQGGFNEQDAGGEPEAPRPDRALNNGKRRKAAAR